MSKHCKNWSFRLKNIHSSLEDLCVFFLNQCEEKLLACSISPVHQSRHYYAVHHWQRMMHWKYTLYEKSICTCLRVYRQIRCVMWTLTHAPVLASPLLKVNLWHLQFCLRADHNYINAGFHLTNQPRKSEWEIWKAMFHWCFSKCIRKDTFCVKFHTVSNLPLHGWNSLNCCEQTEL